MICKKWSSASVRWAIAVPRKDGCSFLGEKQGFRLQAITT